MKLLPVAVWREQGGGDANGRNREPKAYGSPSEGLNSKDFD